METDRVALKTLALATAGVFVVEVLARRAIAGAALPPLAGVGLARLADIALMAAVVATSTAGWAGVGLRRGGLREGLFRGLIWSAGFGALSGLGAAAASLAGYDPLQVIRTAVPAQPAEMAQLLLAGVLTGPLAEELYFRGILYGFMRRWGVAAALAGSTLFFVVLHPGGGGMPVTQIVGGLLFAAAYEIEKNLLVPIVVHSLGNLAIFGLAALL
jgi:hypothetical protein